MLASQARSSACARPRGSRYLGGMRSAASMRMVSPFKYVFSTMCATSAA